jgi:hypothetical protein
MPSTPESRAAGLMLMQSGLQTLAPRPVYYPAPVYPAPQPLLHVIGTQPPPPVVMGQPMNIQWHTRPY